MAILTCDQISVRFDARTILDQVDLQIEQGEYVCIVGANGSGKTTLLKTIAGLIRPFHGQIRFGEGLRRQDIGYLPQQTVITRDFPASVEEVVRSGCLNRSGLRPFYSRAEKDRAQQAMARFEITGLKKRPYRDLSGGQQQRVLLARALCAGSRVLLLDEPVSGLDPLAAAQFYELLARLHQKEHKTLMMVSHDMASALRYAQKIVHVRDNGTVLTETPDTYRDSQAGRHFLHGEGQK